MSGLAAPLSDFVQSGPHRPGKTTILDRMLQVAGNLPRHITMRDSGPRKYIERPNRRHPQSAPVTPELLRHHLDGKITLGSWLANRDGRTWAVMWDADDAKRWDILLEAGRKLLARSL